MTAWTNIQVGFDLHKAKNGLKTERTFCRNTNIYGKIIKGNEKLQNGG